MWRSSLRDLLAVALGGLDEGEPVDYPRAASRARRSEYGGMLETPTGASAPLN
jgi:hypothetical protein